MLGRVGQLGRDIETGERVQTEESIQAWRIHWGRVENLLEMRQDGRNEYRGMGRGFLYQLGGRTGIGRRVFTCRGSGMGRWLRAAGVEFLGFEVLFCGFFAYWKRL